MSGKRTKDREICEICVCVKIIVIEVHRNCELKIHCVIHFSGPSVAIRIMNHSRLLSLGRGSVHIPQRT